MTPHPRDRPTFDEADGGGRGGISLGERDAEEAARVRKRWPWIGAALLVLAGVGWWFGSPWLTLYQMKRAAEARDMAALSAYIDYPALRRDMKAQIRARVGPTREGPRELGDLVAGALAQGVVEAAVRPEAIGAIFAAGAVLGPSAPPIRAEDLTMRRDGFDQFRMVRKDGAPGEIVFRREGFGWKLAAIHVPQDKIRLNWP